MQEEVENRTLTLIVSGTKFTGRLFKAAISKYMAHRREKKLEKQRGRDSPVTPKGKQTVKQLIGQNQGVSNIEINDPSIKDFERIARKYGVDYAVKKDRSTSPPKYLIFFKARDADALTAAFSEYTQKKVKKADRSERASVLAKLAQFKELLKNTVVDRSRRKELDVPERRFVRFLLERRYVYRTPSGCVLPYAKGSNEGLFCVKDFCRNGHTGSYTLVTPKGKLHFAELRQLILVTV